MECKNGNKRGKIIWTWVKSIGEWVDGWMGRVTMMAQCDYYHLVMMCVCYEYIHPPTHPFSIEKEGASHDRFFFLRGKKKGGSARFGAIVVITRHQFLFHHHQTHHFIVYHHPSHPHTHPLDSLLLFILSSSLVSRSYWIIKTSGWCVSVSPSVCLWGLKKERRMAIIFQESDSRAQLLISLCLFYPLTSS